MNPTLLTGQQKASVTGAMKRGGQWRAECLFHKSRKYVWVLFGVRSGAKEESYGVTQHFNLAGDQIGDYCNNCNE